MSVYNPFSAPSDPVADPREVLQRYWGYPAFRPLQEEIIRSVLSGKDTLALLPTGGGKSLCYQVPALCRPGVCLVISPLIALMKDQVGALRKKGIAAAAIFSGLQSREIDARLDAALGGRLKLLYLSPERLGTDRLLGRMDRMPVSLLAVDEAHCIAEWGHDFRPAYRQIAQLREWMEGVPVLALTASATPAVRREIAEQLQLKNPDRYEGSFARPNLTWIVRQASAKRQRLLTMFERVPGTGLVYTKSRRRTKEVAEWLTRQGVSASFYHAGLDAATREQRQRDWMEGRLRIMACTNAFGMGIDKADVRLVAHTEPPESLEAYYQEAGRAGRDGKPCWAGLLADEADLDRLREKMNAAVPDPNDIRKLYHQVAQHCRLAIGAGRGECFPFDPARFARAHRWPAGLLLAGLRLLEQEGYLALNESAQLPARVMMTADREGLYRFQVENKRLDPLIKALQRSTPGLHDHFAPIDEYRIAKSLGVPDNDVRKGIAELEQYDLLRYQPRQEEPQLTWTQARRDARTLPLDLEHIAWRQARHRERIQAMIDYITGKGHCRSVMIQAYFGEEAEPCGQCDLCRRRRKQPEHIAVREAIQALLKRETLRPAELVQRLHPLPEDAVLQALRWLQDRGSIRRGEGNTVTWQA